MNMVLDIKKILTCNKQNQLVSVKIIMIQNKTSIECKAFFKDTNIRVETGINFIENERYDMIISIVILGKQIYKEKCSFIYKKSLVYSTSDKLIDFRITDNSAKNNIELITNLTYQTYRNYNFKINPLAVVREENENCKTIFLNDNIYILRGKLMEIVDKIYCNSKFMEDINKYKKLNDINLLILKGCIICYE